MTADFVNATMELRIGGVPMQLPVSVPRAAVPLEAVLPNFHRLADAVADIGTAAVLRTGASISCRKGCGACCRQPVPVSIAEARALAALVDAMPEPRQRAVRARFAAAKAQLDANGVLARMAASAEAELDTAGGEYFRAGVACPFLEDEACSIHKERPVACREYLVTSPAELCRNPTRDHVRAVPLPAHVGRALRALDRQHGAPGRGWTLLVAALEVETGAGVTRIGPAWLEDGLGLLTEEAIADWIAGANLPTFLTALADLVGFGLAPDDRTRLVAALADTDSGDDRWCACAMPGSKTARLRLARDGGTDTVRIWLEVPAELRPQARFTVRLFQRFRVSE